MATITIEYDGRNTIIKKALDLLLATGAKIKEDPNRKTGVDKSLDDIKHGRIREITDTKAYFRKLGVNV